MRTRSTVDSGVAAAVAVLSVLALPIGAKAAGASETDARFDGLSLVPACFSFGSGNEARVNERPDSAGAASVRPAAIISAAVFSMQPGEQGDAAAVGEGGTAAGADKSGTDPTKFLRTLSVRNEYQRLTNDTSFNITSLTYIEPFAGGRANVRVKAPVVYTDATGDDEFGFGDLSVRANWLPIVDAERGILFGAEVIGDTASEDVLGRGKWILGPSVTYAMFVSPRMIFAPAYQHNVSFAGDNDRGDVNESVIDLYMVFTAADKRSWFIVDPTLVVDWENDENTPVTLEVEYGRNVGALWGGALNAYVRPGVGIGQDRPYDWNVEVGFTVVGF